MKGIAILWFINLRGPSECWWLLWLKLHRLYDLVTHPGAACGTTPAPGAGGAGFSCRLLQFMCVMTGFPVTCYFHTQTDWPPLKSIIESPPLRISALSPADYSPVPDAPLPPETFQAPLTRSLPISWSHRGGSGARLQGKGRPSPPSAILPFNNSPLVRERGFCQADCFAINCWASSLKEKEWMASNQRRAGSVYTSSGATNIKLSFDPEKEHLWA